MCIYPLIYINIGGLMSLNFCIPSVHPPRIPCATLNAFAFPVKDTVVEKIFSALGGQAVVVAGRVKYAHSSSKSLSVHFVGHGTPANYVFVSCYNGICSVEFRQISGSQNSVVQQIENVLLSDLPALFSSVSGIQVSQKP